MPSALHRGCRRAEYATYALADTPSGRLHKALVETGKAAQVGDGFARGRGRHLGIFVALAIVKKGDPVDPVRDEMIRQVEAFHDNPPTAEEMERARVQIAPTIRANA